MSKFICIAGGSGSGKTTVAEALAQALGSRASVLHFDDYQRRKEQVPQHVTSDKQLRRNYEHPAAIDYARFIADLKRLKAGEDVTVACRFKKDTMEDGVAEYGTYVVPPREFVIIEGYLALHFEEARALYDLSVFIAASDATRVARRRWVKDELYVNEVLLPMHNAFIEPTRDLANWVFDSGTESAEMIAYRIRHKLESMPQVVSTHL